jgi:anti-sigma-K factor RskA
VTHDVLDEEQETLAALYALGSLDPEEARAFARHLDEDGCVACRAQVEAMAAVGDDLALAPAAAAPSPRSGSGSSVMSPAMPRSPSPSRSRRRGTGRRSSPASSRRC